MSGPARLHAVAIGGAVEPTTVASGHVHSVFAHSVNLVVGSDLWTLLASARSDMPFGLRTSIADFQPLELRRGQPVSVRHGALSIGNHVVIDFRSAWRWLPCSGKTLAPGLEQRLRRVESAACSRAWPHSAQLARALQAALCTPPGGSIANIIGAGPGATPSGDDVIVGALAVLHSPLAGDALALAALRHALDPLLATTTDLSAHLIRQAAQGWFSRDLHELVQALLAHPQNFEAALARVLETGASSGADTCHGLVTFARSYFIHHQQRQAA